MGELIKLKPFFGHVVVQPTAFCNLNCDYCYLPDRLKTKKMPIEVATAIANGISDIPHQVNIVWHCGEPLATGIEYFQRLLKPFDELSRTGRIIHSIQTNGTLISDQWCRLFRQENIRVGLSIDGNEMQTSARKTWGDKAAFLYIMRGINLLKAADIDFSIIAVVNRRNIHEPEEFYRFFAEEVGCKSLNINIEEQEGFNAQSPALNETDVRNFWRRLWNAWRAKPAMKIREFNKALGWLNSQTTSIFDEIGFMRNFWPTISVDGDVVVLSPEFLSVPESERQQFFVGNVLEKPLTEIVADSVNTWYVRKFFEGIQSCRESCLYFSFCRGGQASNKYFELRNIAGTETTQSRNTRQFVLDAVIDALTIHQEGR